MFGLPGGAILPLYQAMPEYPSLKHILVRHEQNAGHAADAYARASQKVGVAIATSGPGATNLVTPLATAMMDSVPVVAITGQVPRAAIGRDAFQETDTTGITMPITKHNYLVMNAADIPSVMKEAFYIARTGRPGPVLVDIPRDVLTEEAEFEYPETVDLVGYHLELDGDSQMIKQAVELIDSAQRPLLLAGHGVIISNAFAELQELAEKAQIPVITTLLGISGFNGEHILSMGMPGMHGQAHNNWAIDRADLITHEQSADPFARAQHAEWLRAELRDSFLKNTRQHWLDALIAADVPCGPVYSYAEVATEDQFWQNGYLANVEHHNFPGHRAVGIPFELSDTPGRIQGPAPELGQHTEETLLELGYDWDDITRLRDAGVI